MSGTIQISGYNSRSNFTNRQACVIALRNANLPIIVKAQAEQFIERNILKDCGRVPPNCLKAFLIKTIKKMGMTSAVPYARDLFRSDVGYNGYYLDAGKLCSIDEPYDFGQGT